MMKIEAHFNKDKCMEDQENGTTFKCEKLDLDVSGTVEDIKYAIMEKSADTALKNGVNPDEIKVFRWKNEGELGVELDDEAEFSDGDKFWASMSGEGFDEAAFAEVVADRAVWIVSGNNWGFHVQMIGDINQAVPTDIKHSSFRKHKFAIVNRKPADENYWIAQRYSLDKEDENATLEITHESQDEANYAFSVKVVTYQGGIKCSTLLKPDGIKKVFNKNKVESREKTLTNVLAIGGFVLTFVGTLTTLATAGAAAPVAGPIAGAGVVMSGAAALKK